MDKFDRRPNAKQVRQKLLLALVAFSLPAIWFGSLFVFGNDAAPWAILGYVIVFGGFAVYNGEAYLSRFELWRAGLKVQPPLLPGASDHVACFHIRGVDAPVGACLWPSSKAEAAMIEFFTRGNSADLDWLGAPFDEVSVSPDLVRRVMRPVVSEASWKHFRYEG